MRWLAALLMWLPCWPFACFGGARKKAGPQQQQPPPQPKQQQEQQGAGAVGAITTPVQRSSAAGGRQALAERLLDNTPTPNATHAAPQKAPTKPPHSAARREPPPRPSPAVENLSPAAAPKGVKRARPEPLDPVLAGSAAPPLRSPSWGITRTSPPLDPGPAAQGQPGFLPQHELPRTPCAGPAVDLQPSSSTAAEAPTPVAFGRRWGTRAGVGKAAPPPADSPATTPAASVPGVVHTPPLGAATPQQQQPVQLLRQGPSSSSGRRKPGPPLGTPTGSASRASPSPSPGQGSAFRTPAPALRGPAFVFGSGAGACATPQIVGRSNPHTLYREDKRVSLHATPFESRVESAMEEEHAFRERERRARLHRPSR